MRKAPELEAKSSLRREVPEPQRSRTTRAADRPASRKKQHSAARSPRRPLWATRDRLLASHAHDCFRGSAFANRKLQTGRALRRLTDDRCRRVNTSLRGYQAVGCANRGKRHEINRQIALVVGNDRVGVAARSRKHSGDPSPQTQLNRPKRGDADSKQAQRRGPPAPAAR
jgi:hypothetical protein